MARICVDNNVSEFPLDSQKCLGDVIDDVMASLPPNRVVTSIEINGRHLPSLQQSRYRDRQITNEQEVSIKTSDSAVWAHNGVDIAMNRLERVRQSLIEVAEMLRSPGTGKALHYFAQCMEGLERFTENMLITRCVLRLNYETISVEGISLSQLEGQFSSIIQSIADSQESEDYEAIIEQIEFGLLPNLSAWVRALRGIQNDLEREF